jgi:LPXTG-motif cell wall-anchored protein
VLFESGDMTVTIEPGIYLEGNFGVRIEDDVVVERTGNEVITHFPKDLDSAILLPEDFVFEADGSSNDPEGKNQSGSILLGLGIVLILIALVVLYLRRKRKNV